MRCKKAWLICFCVTLVTAVQRLDRNSPSTLLAAPIPPDPSLDVSLTVHGKFVNWETGEQRVATIEPQAIWALANELPTRADLLTIGYEQVEVGKKKSAGQITRRIFELAISLGLARTMLQVREF